jgi:ElaB/YqjD/DUF883 family membrane-anchored ribosome-binding protein
MKKTFQEMSQKFLKEEGKLDATPGGREIISLVEEIGPKMAKDLLVYAKTLKTEQYTPRLFSFVREEDKSGKEIWIAHNLEIAAPETMTGSPDDLRALMKRLADAESTPSIGMWVSPLRVMDGYRFHMFLRHSDGQEAQYALTENVWAGAPQNKHLVDSTLSMLLTMSDGGVDVLKEVMSGQYDVMVDALREAMVSSLEGKDLAQLTDDEWKTVCLKYIASMSNLKVLQECGRQLSSRAIAESQMQLETLSRVIQSASDYNEQKISQMEKDHDRALKKFKSDFEKVKDTGKLKDKRIATLSSEVTDLRKKMRDTSTNPAASSSSIGLALDEFFA